MNLFAPYRIKDLEIKNRFMRSATMDGTADESGNVTNASIAFYRRLSQGGVGLIATGWAFVSTSGRSFRGQYGACTNELIPGLKRLVQAVHKDGAKVILQLVHGGTQILIDGVTAMAVSKMPQNTKSHYQSTELEIRETILLRQRNELKSQVSMGSSFTLHTAI